MPDRDVYEVDGGWACRYCDWYVEDETLTEQRAQELHDADELRV